MEEICSSKTSDDFHWTTGHYIPEDRKNSSVNVVLHFFNITTYFVNVKYMVHFGVHCSF
jgi:hypothetical protein